MSEGARRPRAGSGAVLGAEGVGAAGEEGEVGADGGEGGAERDGAAGRRRVEREEAGGLAGGADAGDGVLDRGDDLGVAGVAEVAEAGREVGGADEEAVDAVDGGDRLEGVEAGAGLDLDDQAELLLGAGEVVGDAAVAGGAGQRRDAAHAARRVAHGGDGGLGLGGGLDVGDEQRLRADVEEALDQRGVVDLRADDRGQRIGREGLELGEDAELVAGRMLGVEQQPVEAGAGDRLGGEAVDQRDPEADLRAALGEGGLEAVAGQVHGVLGLRAGLVRV